MKNFTLLPSKDLNTTQYVVIKVVKIKQFHNRFHIPSGSKSVAHEKVGHATQCYFKCSNALYSHEVYIKYQFSHFCMHFI